MPLRNSIRGVAKCVGDVAMCVGDHAKVFFLFFYFFNTGAVIRPKPTQNSYDSKDILLGDVKRLKISIRDRFV